MATGEELRNARDREGLSREDLAQLTQISVKTIQRIEEGTGSRQSRLALEHYFGLTEGAQRGGPAARQLSDRALWVRVYELLAEINRRHLEPRATERMAEEPSARVLREGQPPVKSVVPPEGHTESGA